MKGENDKSPNARAHRRASDFVQRIMDSFAKHQWGLVMQSYGLQSPDERKARLRTVMALSVELDKIRQQNRFSTALAEGPIEDIIKGDWRGASQYIEMFEFKDEGAEIKERIAPLWEAFRDILRAAVADAEMREKGVQGGN